MGLHADLLQSVRDFSWQLLLHLSLLAFNLILNVDKFVSLSSNIRGAGVAGHPSVTGRVFFFFLVEATQSSDPIRVCVAFRVDAV